MSSKPNNERVEKYRPRHGKTDRDAGYASRRATNQQRRAEYTRTEKGSAQPRYLINDAPSHGKGNSSKAFKLKPAKRVRA